MKDMFGWVLLNVGFALAVWFGLADGVEGALYLAQFFVWVIALPIGLLVLTDDMQRHLLKSPAPERPIRRDLSWLIAWFALGMFVWHGYFITGGAWGIHMLGRAAARDALNKLRAADAAGVVK